MTGRKTSESYFAISSLQSPVSALCFLLGSQRLAHSALHKACTPYPLYPTPYFHLGALCAFARVIFFHSVFPNSTENFIYVWLEVEADLGRKEISLGFESI